MKSKPYGNFLKARSARVASGPLVALILAFVSLPGLLPAQTLLHRYSFASDASDSVGGPAWNGTLVAPNGGSAASINNGLVLPGGGNGGYSGYLALPAGILTNTASVTVECWVAQNTANTWATIWDFGNDGNHNFELAPDPGRNNGNTMVAFTPNGNERDLFGSATLPSGSEQYVTVTYDNPALKADYYINGSLDGTLTLPDSTYAPGSIGGAAGTADNWLGRNVWNDPQFQGTVYELRIWNGALSQRQIAASAILGPGTLVTNLVPTSVNVTAGPSVIITGTEQASVTVQLQQTGSTNLPATADATNWTSSNPSVLVVNSSGTVSGVGVGSATVSATVDGVTATSATITVTGPQALLHRYSFISDASDSVGGPAWNGTLVAPNGGTAATINNGLTLPGGGNADFSGYVSFPSGILTNTGSVTIECWVTQNTANTWATIWDFGNDGTHNFELAPNPGRNNGNPMVAFTPNGNEQDLFSSVPFPSGSEQYVAVTYDHFNLTADYYRNGAREGTVALPNSSYVPGGIGGAAGTADNWLGRDVYNDSQFQGTIYEFRIWNGVLSPVYAAVSAAAGPSVVVTNLTPSSLTVTLTNTAMIGAQTEQAEVIGNFVDASGVNVTGAATNWTSSSPNVLTVDSSGLITAQSGGSATVSATINGMTATSAAITVADTAPTITQAPANQTLAVGNTINLSVGALGGGLSYQWSFDAAPIAGATNATLTLTNVTLAEAGTYSVLVTNNIGSTNVSVTITVVSAILQHRYSFVSDASDSVGGPAWNGTLVAPNGGSPATINNGLSLPGGGGPGYSGYVSLPAGVLTNTRSLTVECWATQDSQNTWAELWNCNNGTGQYIGFIPYPHNNNNNMSMAIKNGNEYDAFSSDSFPVASEQYVAVTFDASTLTGNLYTNGARIASVTVPNSSYIPGTFGGAGGTLNNYLGQDPWPDPQFQGTIYEFRIWDGVVSPLYLAVSAAAGPSVVVTNLTPTSVAVTVTNTSMVAGQTQQAVVVANFVDASGVSVSAEATNWVSSDPNVLTVDSNGVITVVNTGSATISATLNGVTGTSPSITVATSLPIITQQPQADVTLLAGATLNASIANIGTPPFVYYWFTNSGSVPISTSASPVLTLPSVQLANAASYTCLVSNQYGTALSSPLTLTVVSPSTYEQAVLSSGPIAFWPLNETSGSIAYDVVGGNNGTYNGTYSLAQPGPTNSFFGASSYAAGFDGVSAYVDIPGGPFNITGAITVVGWVNLLAQPGFGGLIGHGDASWRISINGQDYPGASDGSAPDATSPTSIPIDGTWHMVAYTYTGNTNQVNNGALYLDGVLVANNTVTTTPAGDNLDVWIGGSPDYGTQRLLPANIADAAVFDKALTAAQVQGLYNGTYVAGPVNIGIAHSGSSLVLTWQTGVLLQAPTLLGPWTTNNAAVSPYTVPVTSSNQFFRVLVNP